MSTDFTERAASEFGVDVETFRAVVDTSFEVWAEITGDTRPLNKLQPVMAIGRVGCVAGLVFPAVIREMTNPSHAVEPKPADGSLPGYYDDATEQRLAEYRRMANEYAKANPNSEQNPFNDIIQGVRDGTHMFEN